MNKENKNDFKKNEFESEILIKNTDLIEGFYFCLRNSAQFLESSKILLDKSHYQTSISISTISIEESMKGLELLAKFRHNENITTDDWKNLTDHKHKLTKSITDAFETLKKGSEDEIKKAQIEVEKYGCEFGDLCVQDLINRLKNKSNIYAHFQKLREKCFYLNWDRLKEKWIVFEELNPEMQEALAFFVYVEAQTNQMILKFNIERYADRLRENGQTLATPSNDTHKGHKSTEKSKNIDLFFPIQRKVDQIKYEKGSDIMKQFMEEKSFQFLSLNICNKSMSKYLKIIAKQDDGQWFLHPMIKAIMMAGSLSDKEAIDGKSVMAVSDDSNQTYSGKPMMTCVAVAKKTSSKCEFIKIHDTEYPEINFTENMLEKIFRTEIIIERSQGKEISSDIWIEALNVIGIRTKMIKLEEIPEAITAVQEMIHAGKLNSIDKNNIERIDRLKVNEWDELDTTLRALVSGTYGTKKYLGYNMYITPSENIRKFKCRRAILFSIVEPFLPTA